MERGTGKFYTALFTGLCLIKKDSIGIGSMQLNLYLLVKLSECDFKEDIYIIYIYIKRSYA